MLCELGLMTRLGLFDGMAISKRQILSCHLDQLLIVLVQSFDIFLGETLYINEPVARA